MLGNAMSAAKAAGDPIGNALVIAELLATFALHDKDCSDRRFPQCSCCPLLISIAELSLQGPTIRGGWPHPYLLEYCQDNPRLFPRLAWLVDQTSRKGKR